MAASVEEQADAVKSILPKRARKGLARGRVTMVLEVERAPSQSM